MAKLTTNELLGYGYELKSQPVYSDMLILRLDNNVHAQKAAYEYAISIAKDNVEAADMLLKRLEKYRQNIPF